MSQVKKKYDDMSVDACMKRYDERREQIKTMIREGRVSASMSGVEYYFYPFAELLEKDPENLKVNLCWDGTSHSMRPNWKQEYIAWRAGLASTALRDR